MCDMIDREQCLQSPVEGGACVRQNRSIHQPSCFYAKCFALLTESQKKKSSSTLMTNFARLHPLSIPLFSISQWHQQCKSLPILPRMKNRNRKKVRKSLPTQTLHKPPPCQKWVAFLGAVFDLYVSVSLKVVIRLSGRGERKRKNNKHHTLTQFGRDSWGTEEQLWVS